MLQMAGAMAAICPPRTMAAVTAASPMKVPPEIIHMIIDESYDDTLALQNCSLISPSFVSQSRKHLFSTISLTGLQDCQPLYDVLVANLEIIPQIRQLDVEYFGWILAESTLPAVLHLLMGSSNLQTVSLFTYASLSPDVLHSFLGVLSSPNIHTVTLGNEPFSIDYLGLTPALKHLKLFNNNHFPDTNDLRRTRPPKLSTGLPSILIETLELGALASVSESRYLSWPHISPIQVTRLRELTLHVWELDEIKVVEEVIKFASKSLTSLVCVSPGSMGLEYLSPALLRCDLQSLRYLTVDFGTGLYTHKPILDLLSGSRGPPSSHIEELAFVVDLPCEYSESATPLESFLSDRGMDTVDGFAYQHRWPVLKMIRFIGIVTAEDLDQVPLSNVERPLCLEKSPLTSAKGLLWGSVDTVRYLDRRRNWVSQRW